MQDHWNDFRYSLFQSNTSAIGGSTYGATLFLQSVCCLKHKTLLDMFFNSTSVKTIEKLLYKFLPVSDSVQLQVDADEISKYFFCADSIDFYRSYLWQLEWRI